MKQTKFQMNRILNKMSDVRWVRKVVGLRMPNEILPKRRHSDPFNKGIKSSCSNLKYFNFNKQLLGIYNISAVK